MGLLDDLRVVRFAAQINATAEAIAAAVFPQLWRRVEFRFGQMSAAEACGYLAAHGGPVVRARAQAALVTAPRLGEWAYGPICDRATAALVQRALGETARTKAASPVRRAA